MIFHKGLNFLWLQLRSKLKSRVRSYQRSYCSSACDLSCSISLTIGTKTHQQSLVSDILGHTCRKLTLNLLDALSKLLELLSNCFNVSLGEKLMEHLRNFSDPEQLQKLRYESMTQSQQAQQQQGDKGQIKLRTEDEVKVAAAIIDLFHLLPTMPSSNNPNYRAFSLSHLS